jgi:hypothetical protein
VNKIIFTLLLCTVAITSNAQWVSIWKYSDTSNYDRYDSLQFNGIYKIDSNYNIHFIPQIKSNGYFLIGFGKDSAKLIAYTSQLQPILDTNFGIFANYIYDGLFGWSQYASLPQGHWLLYCRKDTFSFTQTELLREGNADGNVTVYNTGKNVVHIASFKDCKQDGFFEHFDPSGNLISMGYSKNGGITEAILFFENQKIHWLISVAKKYEKHWSSQGKLVYYATIKEDPEYGSIHDGPVKAWHDSGKLDFTGQFTDGKPTGKWFYYNTNGKLIKTENR